MRLYKRLLQLTLCGLTSVCLMMSLSSCAHLAVPPDRYLQDCHITYLSVKEAVTNGVVAKLAVDREFDLRDCNVDKAALRAWKEAYCAANAKVCKVKAEN